MFIGFIGFIYVQGYSGIWIGLVCDLGASRCMDLALQVHSERRQRTGRSLALFPCFKTTGAPEAKLAGILSVAFLSIYAAAQLVAGGVALKPCSAGPK